MPETSFKNARLKNVVFFNCNLKGVDFAGAQFDDVTFISTNLQEPKNLNLYNCIYSIFHSFFYYNESK